MVTGDLVLTHQPTLAQLEAALNNDPRLPSAHTRRAYRADLVQFEAWRGGRPLTKLLVEAYAAHLQGEGKSASTINRALAAIRWYARKLGDLAFEVPLSKAQRDEIVTQAARAASVRDVKGNSEPAGRHITPGELTALLTVCMEDASATGVRDAAIIALAWSTGMRRSEICHLQRADFVPTGDDEGEITIRKGKGNKTRTGYVLNGAFAALQDWLALRGPAPGPLFYAIRKGGYIQAGNGIGPQSLRQMLNKRLAAAKVSPLTWHDFRRTFAGNLLDAGVDLVTVQKLMGHSSPTTTANYDRRGEESKRNAVRALHVPYRRRER